MVALQLQTLNHPTTIRQSNPNQICFDCDCLFQYRWRNSRGGNVGLLTRLGWDARTGRAAVPAFHVGGSWPLPRGRGVRGNGILSRRRFRKPPHLLEEQVKTQDNPYRQNQKDDNAFIHNKTATPICLNCDFSNSQGLFIQDAMSNMKTDGRSEAPVYTALHAGRSSHTQTQNRRAQNEKLGQGTMRSNLDSQPAQRDSAGAG